MEEDKRLQAAGALVAIIGLVILVVQFAGNRPAAAPSSGPGWYSRYNPFGSAPSARPAPDAPPAAELAPPERVMTNAATRQFSSPTPAGSVGGLPGAEPTSTGSETRGDSAFSAPRLAGASVDIPGGGRAPVAGGLAAPPAPPPGGRGPALSAGGGGGADAPATGAPARSGGGTVAPAAPGGETAASAGGADAFSRAAGGNVEKGGAGPAPRLGPMGADGVTRPKTEELKETPSLAASAGGGGGPGAGEGGGGGGGSGGMGGAVPAGKPKASAGKPQAGGAAGGAPVGGAPTGGAPTGGAPTGGGAGGGGFSPDGATDPQTGTALTGALDVGEGVPSGHRFSLAPGGPAVIETVTILTKKNIPVVGFTAKMAIDADGPGGGKDGDSTYQAETALQVNGKSLDARRTPFIVIPGDFKKAHKDVSLGDFAAVTYGGKTYYGIVGDIGPKGVLGEASPVVARAVGINPHPVSGGIRSPSVRYYILPKSARRPAPTGDAEIQSVVGAAFAAAGAELK